MQNFRKEEYARKFNRNGNTTVMRMCAFLGILGVFVTAYLDVIQPVFILHKAINILSMSMNLLIFIIIGGLPYFFRYIKISEKIITHTVSIVLTNMCLFFAFRSLPIAGVTYWAFIFL